MDKFDFKIREFDKALDFEAVLEMEQECFEPYEAWNREQYENILDDPDLQFFVAYDEATLAGSTFVWTNQGDDKDTAHLDHNVVAPKYRRQGLGRYFTELRLLVAKQFGDKKAIVEVAEDNIPSIKLLQSVGFKEYGRFPKYYKNKKDAILMHVFLEEVQTEEATEEVKDKMKIRLIANLLYEIHDMIEDTIDLENRIV